MINQLCQIALRFDPWHSNMEAMADLIRALVEWSRSRAWCGLVRDSVQFSCLVVSDSVTPWTAARQASLSITNSWSLLKLKSIVLVMPQKQIIISPWGTNSTEDLGSSEEAYLE